LFICFSLTLPDCGTTLCGMRQAANLLRALVFAGREASLVRNEVGIDAGIREIRVV